MPCSGNSSEICGAGARLSLYGSGLPPPPPPSNPTIANWTSIGCYTYVLLPSLKILYVAVETKVCLFFSDNVNNAGRSLSTGVAVTGGLTMEKCTAACFAAGFPLAGGEYAGFVSFN